MTPVGFFLYFIGLIIVFIIEDLIVDHINNWLKETNIKFRLKERWLTYILVTLLVIVTIMGFFVKQDRKNVQMQVTQSMQNLKPKTTTDAIFDFNFDIFDF